jgi:hypothetical protein
MSRNYPSGSAKKKLKLKKDEETNKLRGSLEHVLKSNKQSTASSSLLTNNSQ